MSDQFHAERARGIGGSDVDDVLSLEPYGCARRLFMEKTGVVPDFPVSGDAIERGKAMEPIIIDIFSKKTGYRVERVAEAFFHPKYPFMLAHIDGLVEIEDGSIGVLETKSPGRESFNSMQREGVPQGYILQVQQGMFTTGTKFGYFVAHCADYWTKLLYFRVEADPKLQKLVLDACTDFWAKVARMEEPPRLDVKDPRCKRCSYRSTCQGELLDKLIDEGAAIAEYDETIAGILEHLLEAKEVESAAKANCDAIERKVKELLGNRQVVDAPGVRAYFKAQEATKLYTGDAIKQHRDALLQIVEALWKEQKEPHEGLYFSLRQKLSECFTPRVSKSRPLRVYARGK